MTPRHAIIRQLIDTARSHMAEIAAEEEATTDEVISAYITMTRDAVWVAKEHGASVPALRSAILGILLHLDDPNQEPM